MEAVKNPIEAALAVKSQEGLVEFLADLAESARLDRVPVENPQTSEFIEASSAWLEGLDGFMRQHTGEGAPESPTWATVALIFSAGLVYE
ncbi:DUF7660 family protein [Streptomyces chrestomyceticus]|uniref:DUF7660 family protein n=1 Tax=Streptomyces chrestomyceticus TaxID=68185 RepID=UPI0033EBF14C